MSQTESSEEAPAASLVGSLSVFTLSDVLTMLASTAQTGELQVVSETADGQVWLDDGELSNAQVGAATTIGQAVFELACVTDGWFYFTTGLLSLQRAARPCRLRPSSTRSDPRSTSGGRFARMSPWKRWSPWLPTLRDRTSRSAATSGGC